MKIEEISTSREQIRGRPSLHLQLTTHSGCFDDPDYHYATFPASFSSSGTRKSARHGATNNWPDIAPRRVPALTITHSTTTHIDKIYLLH